ncbi:MAG: YbaN family protein [Candidatus Sericytochromatia bacterium]|nr:YbaN family protein [Candidatus Sericytochromatia bacterium]
MTDEQISGVLGDVPDGGPVAPRAVIRSRFGRWLLIAAGSLCVILAVIGAVLPLLPTTPFLLLAAACFARSSARLHGWLYTNRYFGEYLRRYQAGEGLPMNAKLSVLAVLWLSLVYSAVVVPDRLSWLRLLFPVIGAGVTVFLLRLKTRQG